MQKLLDGFYSEESELFSLSNKLKPEDVQQTQAVDMGQFFIHLLASESGSLTLTAKGNIKPKHCTMVAAKLLEFDPDEMREINEDRFVFLTRLKHVLQMAGYIDILKTRIKLTKKGYDYILKNDPVELYLSMMEMTMDEYDWVGDYIFNPVCAIIQDSALFSLYMLHKKGEVYLPKREYYNLFEKAFPHIREIPVFTNGINIMPKVFDLLFFNDICRMFGLIDRKPDLENMDNSFYRSSQLFRKLFLWKV